MRYEVSSKALYNQLLYFRSLWALDDKKTAAAAAAVGGKETRTEGKDGGKNNQDEEADDNSVHEKVNAMKEWNRERFQTCFGVVEAYLKRCGRVWVQMDELFRFALGK